MYGKLPDNITLKNVVILMTCAIKDGDKHFIHNYFRRSIASYIYNWWKNYVKKILVSIKELNDINFKILKKDHMSIYIK